LEFLTILSGIFTIIKWRNDDEGRKRREERNVILFHQKPYYLRPLLFCRVYVHSNIVKEKLWNQFLSGN
jgi:hypothetical protein